MAKLIAGNSNLPLALKLAKELKIPAISGIATKFPDGELRINITDDLYNEQVVILQSTSTPANDNLMELLFIADQSKKMGAKRIVAVIPYLCYSRQDRAVFNRDVISLRMVATLLEAVGVDHIITIDIHSLSSIGLFRIMMQNINTTQIFEEVACRCYGKSYSTLLIVSPDIGSISRTRLLSSVLGCDIAVMNKSRDRDNQCHLHAIMGNVANRDCIIVDDIVANGDTLLKAVDLLLDNNASSVSAYITHGVLNDKNYAKFENSKLKTIYITDTIHRNETLPEKFNVISVLPLLKEALQKIVG